MSKPVSPAARLRAVNKRISELRAEQIALVSEVANTVRAERTCTAAINLAEEVHKTLDGDHHNDLRAKRRLLALMHRLDTASTRVMDLPASEARNAAAQSLDDAVARVLNAGLLDPAEDATV